MKAVGEKQSQWLCLKKYVLHIAYFCYANIILKPHTKKNSI